MNDDRGPFLDYAHTFYILEPYGRQWLRSAWYWYRVEKRPRSWGTTFGCPTQGKYTFHHLCTCAIHGNQGTTEVTSRKCYPRYPSSFSAKHTSWTNILGICLRLYRIQREYSQIRSRVNLQTMIVRRLQNFMIQYGWSVARTRRSRLSFSVVSWRITLLIVERNRKLLIVLARSKIFWRYNKSTFVANFVMKSVQLKPDAAGCTSCTSHFLLQPNHFEQHVVNHAH